MTVKFYTEQFAGILPDIYETLAHFGNTFGTLQVNTDVKSGDDFLKLKVNTQPVVFNDYNKGENVAFGTGTGNSNRFGARTEIIYENKTVAYEAPLAIHEGIDVFTADENIDTAVAERLAKHAEAWTEYINGLLATALSGAKSATITGGVVQAFNEARQVLVNNKIRKNLGWTAYVTSEVYTYLVDNKLTTTAKGSDANVGAGEIRMFKGFKLEETPDEYFAQTAEGALTENVMFAVDGIGVVGVGLEIARAMDSEDFAGSALQAAAQYGKYVNELNKKGVIAGLASLDETAATLTPVV